MIICKKQRENLHYCMSFFSEDLLSNKFHWIAFVEYTVGGFNFLFNCTHCMDVWMDGWMDGWMDEWMNELPFQMTATMLSQSDYMWLWTSEWMSPFMSALIDLWANRWMNEWMKEWMNEWMNEFVSGGTLCCQWMDVCGVVSCWKTRAWIWAIFPVNEKLFLSAAEWKAVANCWSMNTNTTTDTPTTTPSKRKFKENHYCCSQGGLFFCFMNRIEISDA